jgi:hypothetical protein
LVGVFLSVSLDDGDLMLISAKVGGDGRCHPGEAFHSISSQHGKRPPFDLTSSHPPRYRFSDHA